MATAKNEGTILIVEPNVLVRLGIAEYLRECGYKVVEAIDGDEAKQIVEKENAWIDVAVIEVGLPGPLDGFGLARWVRARNPSIRVQLTGTILKAASIAADLCDEGPLLAAPYSRTLLVERIKRLLASAERDG